MNPQLDNLARAYAILLSAAHLVGNQADVEIDITVYDAFDRDAFQLAYRPHAQALAAGAGDITEAARYRWLRDWLVKRGVTTALYNAVSANTAQEFDKEIDRLRALNNPK